MANLPAMSLAGFVLAAGLGTRIGALSRHRPKPLLPIGLDTAFHRAAHALRAAGAEPIVANAAHLAEQIVRAGQDLAVEVVVERDGPYGTAGGLAHARARFGAAERVAVWNGDIVSAIDVGALEHALLTRDAAAALAVRGHAPIGAGNVGLSSDGRVVRLRDRAFGPEAHGAWFAAVQVLDRVLVEAAPARGCLVGDVLLPALARGVRVVAVSFEGPWHDVGDPRAYLDANLAEAPLVAVDVELGRDVRLGRAIVGRGARVEGAGLVEDVVVWPGAVACAPLRGVVVTDGGEILPVHGYDALP